MILTRDQINRYMRHIAMQEISGQGQKKILDSSLAFFSENPAEASLALYYISASGIGNVYCRFNDAEGWENLLHNLSDLNGDASFKLLDRNDMGMPDSQGLTCIISGSMSFAEKTLQDIMNSDMGKYDIPIIVSIHNGWRGIIRTLSNQAEVKEFREWMDKLGARSNRTYDYADNFSCCFSGLMAVIEHIKLILAKGKPLSEALYFNLSAMEFDYPCSLEDALQKLLSPEQEAGSIRIPSDSKVLIAGCGGLGSPAAFSLAASGVGELGLVDFDIVEISNLNRQIMHSTSRIGMPKVQSAEIFLRQINPNIRLNKHKTRIGRRNAQDIISPYDIIIGGLDNLPSRYILNDACYAAGKPLIEAGALDVSGLATTIIPGEGHCYRCIFPETAGNEGIPSCSETGVLGPVPGVLGIIQAAEAVKLLTGIGKSLKNRILLFDVFDTDIYVAAHGKNKYCDLCGNK